LSCLAFLTCFGFVGKGNLSGSDMGKERDEEEAYPLMSSVLDDGDLNKVLSRNNISPSRSSPENETTGRRERTAWEQFARMCSAFAHVAFPIFNYVLLVVVNNL
jgi:hypothetical protein